MLTDLAGITEIVCLTLCITIETSHRSNGQTYNQTKTIYSDQLTMERYNNQVRPVQNQSDIIYINVLFETVAIVDVDDVAQSFSCNGFVLFSWKDELVPWDPEDYGGQKVIHPMPIDIWRPRVGIMNTLDDRDPFKDDHALLRVRSDGLVDWVPGSLFLCSCKLDLTNYPFDEQDCYIMDHPHYTLVNKHICSDLFLTMTISAAVHELRSTDEGPNVILKTMAALQHSADEIQFLPTLPTVGKMFYVPNGEWELLGSEITTFNRDIGLEQLPIVKISFQLKRRPTFFLLNIVLPVVLLSLLNILVFIIPVESGEKISYGITVQLALAVYLSDVSDTLPRVSETLPVVMIYLFMIFLLSLLTVVTTMVIVYLHHKEQAANDKVKHGKTAPSSSQKQSHYPRNTVNPERQLKNPTENIKINNFLSAESRNPYGTKPGVVNPEATSYDNRQTQNKYRLIGKYINIVSFSIFFTLWITLTLCFLISVSGILKSV